MAACTADGRVPTTGEPGTAPITTFTPPSAPFVDVVSETPLPMLIVPVPAALFCSRIVPFFELRLLPLTTLRALARLPARLTRHSPLRLRWLLCCRRSARSWS